MYCFAYWSDIECKTEILFKWLLFKSVSEYQVVLSPLNPSPADIPSCDPFKGNKEGWGNGKKIMKS